MKTATDLLKTVRATARQLGATVDVATIGKWTRVTVDAPRGNLWSCAGDLHCLFAEWRVGEKGYRESSLADLLDRMGHGLCDCDDEECDTCHPE